jgi:hypothetical protein
MDNANTFSEEFLCTFPPTKSHHNIIKCLQSQRGNNWTPFQKELIIREITVEGKKYQVIADYLQVSISRIDKLMSAKRNGKIFCLETSRPRRLDDESINKLEQTITDRASSGQPLKKNSELKPLIIDMAVKTDIRRGGSGLNVTVSDSTIRNIIQESKITLEIGQTTTEARNREKHDLRNMVSMAAVNHAFAFEKSPYMIGNFDATQFVATEKNEEKLAVIKSNSDGPLTLTETQTLDQAIKWYMICNAAGIIGEDVFVVADPTMDEDDCVIHTVYGLSHSTMIGGKGYLCVARSRSGNLKFYRWYFSNVVIPFAKSCRLYLPEDMQQQSFYMIADGEETQIKPVECEDICQGLNNANIDFIKGPASCTDTIGNACDRSHVFKSAKKVAKNSKPYIAADYEDSSLEDVISKLFKDYHPNIHDSKRKVLSKGLVKLIRSLSIVVNHKIVAHGFERVGLYPLSVKKCLSNCSKDVLNTISPEELDNIEEKIPELAKYFLDSSEGQLREEVMDQYNIRRFDVNDRRTLDKDKRCQSHQRAVVLNSFGAIKRRKAWLESRKSKKRPSLSADLLPTDSLNNSTSKRSRAPNRDKQVILAEKALKRQRKIDRESRVAAKHGQDSRELHESEMEDCDELRI